MIRPVPHIALLLGGLLLASTPVTSQPRSEPDLRLAFPFTEIDLDPAKLEDYVTMFVDLQIHRGLMRYTAEGELKPDLADSWVVGDGGRSIKFKLREATFSDGTRITAEHVVHSLARLFFVGSSIASDMEAVVGAKQFRKDHDLKGLGIRATGPDEVEIRLERLSGLILKQLAAVDCAVLPIRDFRAPFAVKLGVPLAGPYKLAELGKDRIRLTAWRSDKLQSPRPPRDVVIDLTNEDPKALARQGKSDSLDKEALDAAEQQAFAALGWRPTVTELNVERMLILNPGHVPRPMRLALTQAIDQVEMMRQLGNKGMQPAFGLIPTVMPGSLSADAEKAIVQDAAPAPTKGEDDNRPVKLIYNASPANDLIVKYLKSVWAPLGYQVTFVAVTRAELLKQLLQKSGEIILGVKGLDYFDGYSVLAYFRSGYDGNVFFVEDPAIDRELDRVFSLVDEAERTTAYRQLQTKILGHLTVAPLAFGSDASGFWSKRAFRVPAHPGGIQTLPLEAIEMDEGG